MIVCVREREQMPKRPQDNVRALGTRVTGGCASLGLGVGYTVLFKRRKDSS